MDYIVIPKLVADTEAKKNTVRDALISLFETNTANGNIKSWSMTINGKLVPAEDNESYSSE